MIPQGSLGDVWECVIVTAGVLVALMGGGAGKLLHFFKSIYPKISTMNMHHLINVQRWLGRGCGRVKRSFCFKFLFLEGKGGRKGNIDMQEKQWVVYHVLPT